jgi:aminopeptidase N
MVAISNYQHFQQVYTGAHGEVFPMDYWVFDEDLTDAQMGVADMPEVMDLLSGYFGTYPFDTEKYAMTQLGFYGGIENQTNTIINSMSIGWLLGFVHELAHMWFGDMITCESWHHGWLNEGFATYSEALFLDHWAGWNAYQEHMAYHAYYQGGTLYLQDISDPFSIFIGIIYSKGSWVLHMLRGMLGDQDFFDCIYTYAQSVELRYGHATTEDFLRICEQVAGRNLGFFFDQWVYDERYPIYYWSYAQDDSTLDVTVNVRQTQGSNGWRPVFEMPIRLRLVFQDASDSVVTVWNDQEEQTYTFQAEKDLDRVGFDYGLWILKEGHQVGVDEAPPAPGSPLVSLGTSPNPFTTATQIRYDLAGAATTSVRIFDVVGREVRALVPSGYHQPGPYAITWDGRTAHGDRLAPGLYVCEIRADDTALTTRLHLTR